MNTSSLNALSDYSKLTYLAALQITVEESDNENDDDDYDDDKATAAMMTSTAGASGGGGDAGKPSTSQNQTTHTGM